MIVSLRDELGPVCGGRELLERTPMACAGGTFEAQGKPAQAVVKSGDLFQRVARRIRGGELESQKPTLCETGKGWGTRKI